MKQGRFEVLCGKESYRHAHRDREFHQTHRAEIRYEERRAFRAAMAAKHVQPKVTPLTSNKLTGTQLAVFNSMRRASEIREADRVRNLGRPTRY